MKKITVLMLMMVLMMVMASKVMAEDQLKTKYGYGMTKNEFKKTFVKKDKFQENEDALIFFNKELSALHWVRFKDDKVIGVVVTVSYDEKVYAILRQREFIKWMELISGVECDVFYGERFSVNLDGGVLVSTTVDLEVGSWDANLIITDKEAQE